LLQTYQQSSFELTNLVLISRYNHLSNEISVNLNVFGPSTKDMIRIRTNM